MVYPFVAFLVDVLLGAERPLVELHLGALIDQRAGVARERHAVLLALEEILPHLGADLFEQEADMRGDRIVAQHRVALLGEIAEAERRKRPKDHDRDRDHFPDLDVVIEDSDGDQQCRDDGADRQDDEAWRERKQQRFHGTPRAIPPNCCYVWIKRAPNSRTRYRAWEIADMTT